jgi:hypothetical protein
MTSRHLGLCATLPALAVACGGATSGGIPEDCEVRVDGQCYATETEACAAANCPAERCIILESYPGQVDCQPEDDGQTDEPADGDEPVASPLPEGSPCTPESECAEGLFCHGDEGCDVEWTCQPMRPCTRDLVVYCGCDGETFQGSGSCPGRPYQSRGACPE